VFAGALAGSVIYNAFFVMVSVLTTRAIAVGLLYLLVWEGLLGNLVSGASELSIGQYSLGLANSIARDPALNAHLTLTTVIAGGAIVTAAALAVAIRRLGAFSLKGDAA
jgi:ABC-2 type transport system permease protein